MIGITVEDPQQLKAHRRGHADVNGLILILPHVTMDPMDPISYLN